jgi:hypothetical protein
MQDNYGIKPKQITSNNPKANSIIELRPIDLENNNWNLKEKYPFDFFFQSTAWLSIYKKHLPHITSDISLLVSNL